MSTYVQYIYSELHALFSVYTLARTQQLHVDRKRSIILLIWLICNSFSPAKYSSNTLYAPQKVNYFVDLAHLQKFFTRKIFIYIISKLCKHNLPTPTPQDEDDLDVECGKKSIEHNALVSKDGNGITEEMSFGNRGAFDKFWDWFMPN